MPLFISRPLPTARWSKDGESGACFREATNFFFWRTPLCSYAGTFPSSFPRLRGDCRRTCSVDSCCGVLCRLKFGDLVNSRQETADDQEPQRRAGAMLNADSVRRRTSEGVLKERKRPIDPEEGRDMRSWSGQSKPNLMWRPCWQR